MWLKQVRRNIERYIFRKGRKVLVEDNDEVEDFIRKSKLCEMEVKIYTSLRYVLRFFCEIIENCQLKTLISAKIL